MEVLARTEATPAEYPKPPGGLSQSARGVSFHLVWARIEEYVAHRWTPREVSWVIQGQGDWAPDLAPATISTVEKWSNSTWSSTSLDASWSGGYVLQGDLYRVIATVGGGHPPNAAVEAYRRLAEYMAQAIEVHGAGRYEMKLGDGLHESFDRNPAWMAKALQLSGAADLLRGLRRVPGC